MPHVLRRVIKVGQQHKTAVMILMAVEGDDNCAAGKHANGIRGLSLQSCRCAKQVQPNLSLTATVLKKQHNAWPKCAIHAVVTHCCLHACA